MTLDEVGKQVAEWRKRRNIGQAEFCRANGISRTTLSQLENGKLLELGYNRVQRILTCFNKELTVREASPVPTLDEILRENWVAEQEEESSPMGPGW